MLYEGSLVQKITLYEMSEMVSLEKEGEFSGCLGVGKGIYLSCARES